MPEQSHPLKLYAFTCGWFQAPVRFFLDGGEGDILRSPVPTYLIDHPKGLAVFDTGLGARFRSSVGQRLAADATGFEFDEASDIGARLRAMEVDPDKVRWVINSHLHPDHCGGNASLPNATIVIQRRELDAARAQSGGPAYTAVDFETGQKILAIDGEYDLFGDGSALIFPSYGHTPGHQCLRVRLAKGDVVLAADCCYLKRSLDEMRLSGQVFDKEESMRTLQRLADLRRSGTRIFYGHDGTFWNSVPQATAIA